MTTQRSLLAIAIALGFGYSGAVLANQGGDGSPNTNADDGSAAVNDSFKIADSGNDNSDNSTHVADSANDNSDNSTDVSDSFKIKDSGNDNSDNSTHVADSANDNSDNSTDVTDSFKIKDSGNDNSDNSTDVTDSFKIKDSGNDNSDNSINDSFKIADSGNDNSDNSDNSTTDVDLNVFLNEAELNGVVNGVATAYALDGDKGGMAAVTNHNEISGGSANFTGVGAIAQSAGNGNLTQANVSVMSNLTTNAQ